MYIEIIINIENGFQQFQMESCQPIKRLKDKKKKKKKYYLANITLVSFLFRRSDR